MPFLFREGLVFMPGESALFRSDKQSKPILCTVKGLVKDENTVLTGYRIISDEGKEIYCACEQLFPIPGE